jgi:hypothetical protein
MVKGELNLKRLKLRDDALDRLKLPLNISEGKADSEIWNSWYNL